jgi:hypothetical protein
VPIVAALRVAPRAADDARALSVLAEVDRLGREATSAHGGTLVDGPLVGTARAVFPSAEGAVLAGIALQASLDALPSLPPVRAAQADRAIERREALAPHRSCIDRALHRHRIQLGPDTMRT